MRAQMNRRHALQLVASGAFCATDIGNLSAVAKTLDTNRANTVSFFSEVASGVWVHQGQHAHEMTPANAGDISNCGVIVGKEAVALIDTGGSAKFGNTLKAAVAQISKLPIRYVINTHMHPDHVFGNAAFVAENTAFVGHAKLARGLSARAERYMSVNKRTLGDAAFAGTKIVLPTLEVQDTMSLDLGGRTLILKAQKTAHTDNDLTIRDETTDTVFMGDLIFSGHTPTLDGSIKGWLRRLNELSAKPAARVVPGHGPASMAWPDAAKPMKRYFSTIAREIRAILARDGTLKEAMSTVGLSEKGAWQLFDEYHVRNVSAAFAELEWE